MRPFSRREKLQTISVHLVRLVLLAALMLGVLTSCDPIDYFPCIEPEAAPRTEVRMLPGFSGVDVQLGAEVVVLRGNTFGLEITAPENFLDVIETYVSGETLKIRTDQCLKCQPRDIQIQVTVPDLDHLKMSGSGTLELLEPFEGNHMAIDLYGSGDIYAGVIYDRLRTRIYGSGNIELSGIAGHHDALITGSGNLVCFPLDSDTAEATITGSGNAYLLVRDALSARITGSGNIFFRGSPWIQSEITGTGDLIPFH